VARSPHPHANTITREELRLRLHDHVYMSYTNYSFFIKGAVIAAAALSFIYILGASDLHFKWTRLILWGASLGFSLVSIATWSRGSAFTSYRANMLDLLLPVGMGLVEVSMYVLLAPALGSVSDLPIDAWLYWYLALACHTFLAMLLVGNRLLQTRMEDYADDLHGLVGKYRRWLWLDFSGAGVLFVVGAAIFCFSEVALSVPSLHSFAVTNPDLGWVHVVLGGFFAVIALAIVGSASSQYDELSREVGSGPT
jgi:hypothetical protein